MLSFNFLIILSIIYCNLNLCLYPIVQIIYIQGLVMVLLLGKLIRKIFFGQLRTAEMEV